MDDVKREVKVKRSKTDVKNVISTYLQKRNYPSVSPVDVSKHELINQHLVDSELSRPNSILYNCCNCDPIVIDQNFGKFTAWLRDLTKRKNKYHDIEYIVGPLFCHLYLDILRGGNSEGDNSKWAAAFFKCHLPSVDKLKCDNMVQDLIKSFHNNDADKTGLKENFRAHKFMVDLYPESLAVLQKFIDENCHVVFLQVLQTWFEIQEVEEIESETSEEDKGGKRVNCDAGYSKLKSVMNDLKNDPKPLFNLNLANCKHQINSGFIKRESGLIGFSENNLVCLKPIPSYDSLFNFEDYGDIKLTGHSGLVYSIDLAPNNNYISTGSSDNTICLYNLSDFTVSHVCKGHMGPVYCTKISTNGEYVLSGSQDTTARLWSVHTGQSLRVFLGHTQSVTALDFHPNCLYVATGSADCNVRLWSIDNGNPMRLLHGAKGTIYSIAFNPNGHCLASASDDKRIRIWDLINSKVQFELVTIDEPVIKLIWSNDGKLLCGGTCDGVVSVWDISKIQDNINNEPIKTHHMHNKLLNLDYAFGTFGTLTTT